MKKEMKKRIEYSPVHLRTKKIAHGRESLYLDMVVDGVRVKEYLGIHLVPEKTRGDKSTNRAAMRAAEEIRAKRIVELLEDKRPFAGKNAGRVNLLDWLEEQRAYYYDHGNTNYSRTIQNLMRHIGKFAPQDNDDEGCHPDVRKAVSGISSWQWRE